MPNNSLIFKKGTNPTNIESMFTHKLKLFQ